MIRKADICTLSRELSGEIELKFLKELKGKCAAFDSEIYEYLELPYQSLAKLLKKTDLKYPESCYEVRDSNTGRYLRLRSCICGLIKTIFDEKEIDSHLTQELLFK